MPLPSLCVQAFFKLLSLLLLLSGHTCGVEVKGKGRMLTFLWSPEVDHPGEDLAASAQATEETIHAST
eukprot:scaffold12622_cov19-Tisochrysis_lutea.AAC.2